MKYIDLQSFADAAYHLGERGDMIPMANTIIKHALAMNSELTEENLYVEPIVTGAVWEVEDLIDLDLLRTFGAMCVEAGGHVAAGKQLPLRIVLHFDRYAQEIERRLEKEHLYLRKAGVLK